MSRRHYYVSILLIFSILLVACKQDGKKDAATTTKPLTTLKIHLSWEDTIEFAGFYEADEHGLFKKEGLTVTTIPGGYDAAGNVLDPIQAVLDGKADFGIVSSDLIIAARAAGKPVVALAAIYQRNPLVYMTLKSSGIQTPQDWQGKKIRVEPDVIPVLTGVLKSVGLTLDDVEQVPTDFSTDPLLTGEVDFMSGFITNEGVALTAQGVEYNVILPSDYGVEIYSNVIFTTEAMLQNHPDWVEKLLRAVFAGYQMALDDPTGAAKLSVARNPTLTIENETASMLASVPLLHVPGMALGEMKPEAWASTMQVLLDAGILAGPIDITQAYDLSFIEKIHDN